MAKFQLLSALIAPGGDIQNTVARGGDRPITYPEMLTLAFLHGENAIRDTKVVGSVERTDREEKARLSSIYGSAVVDQMFPGVASRLPSEDPDFPPDEFGAAVYEAMNRPAPAVPQMDMEPVEEVADEAAPKRAKKPVIEPVAE